MARPDQFYLQIYISVTYYMSSIQIITRAQLAFAKCAMGSPHRTLSLSIASISGSSLHLWIVTWQCVLDVRDRNGSSRKGSHRNLSSPIITSCSIVYYYATLKCITLVSKIIEKDALWCSFSKGLKIKISILQVNHHNTYSYVIHIVNQVCFTQKLKNDNKERFPINEAQWQNLQTNFKHNC